MKDIRIDPLDVGQFGWYQATRASRAAMLSSHSAWFLPVPRTGGGDRPPQRTPADPPRASSQPVMRLLISPGSTSTWKIVRSPLNSCVLRAGLAHIKTASQDQQEITLADRMVGPAVAVGTDQADPQRIVVGQRVHTHQRIDDGYLGRHGQMRAAHPARARNGCRRRPGSAAFLPPPSG